MEEKDRVRKECLSQRKALSEEEVSELSRKICEKLLKQSWYPECRNLLVYSAVRNEVDLSSFLRQAWVDGKQIYFPKVFGETMEFFRTDSFERLQKGTFGVLEPVSEEYPYQKNGKSVILVPGVAFSECGARIGYGKGYYDRYLSKDGGFSSSIVGVAYELQIVEDFETESNDINMHQIVTECREVVLEG